MALKDELTAYVNKVIAVETWTEQDARVVPYTSDVPLNNTAKKFERATFLYADLAGSTEMVSQLSWQRCAEIYKTYLYCASKMIRSQSGDVVAFDGDRVMGVFVGDMQSTNAVKCALKINWARINIVQAKYDNHYGAGFKINHTIGVDTGMVRCCRTGVRGDNDLVWVGEAPNIAAKLTTLDNGYTWITKEVYNKIADDAKTTNGQSMWEERSWTARANRTIYRSSWHWSI